MRNKILLAILTVALVLGMTACKESAGGGSTGTGTGGGGTVYTFDSIPAFKAWLAAQPVNTATTAYSVKLNVSALGGEYNTAGSVGDALYTNKTKYVNLDLSGSAFTSIEIEWYAFRDCISLTSLNIPNSVTTIGSYVFWGCTSLTGITIPNSVTTIGEGVFADTSLTSITIPNSVTSIASGAFSGCTSLTTINVAAGNTAYASQDGVLYNKTKTTLIRCPEGKAGALSIPSGVTSIGNNAFRGCTRLTSVTIPNSVSSIGSYAFDRCTSLASVTFATGSNISDTNFGNNAFPEGSGGAGGNTLKTAYSSGKAGTYTRAAGGSTWTKQP